MVTIDTAITVFTNIKSAWSVDLNVKHRLMKLLGEKVEENAGDLSLSRSNTEDVFQQRKKSCAGLHEDGRFCVWKAIAHHEDRKR